MTSEEASILPRFLVGADDQATLLNILFQGRNFVQVVRCAVLFSLAEHLDGPEPARADEVAAAEGLHAGATHRLLRACVAYGLAASDNDGRFTATPLLRTLRKDAGSIARDRAIFAEGPAFWSAWGRLDQAVRSGAPQVEAALGADVWGHYASAAGAGEAAAFTRSMTGFSAATDAGAADLIDASGAEFAVDVGGAGGSLLLALAKRHHDLRGVVLDLPHNEAGTVAAAAEAGLSDRIGFVAGDFREAVPAADLYLLKWVLHDWPDDTCLDILRACRRAAKPGARLMLLEMAMDDAAPTPVSVGMDLNMLTVLGGKERTLAEFSALLGSAGLRLDRHQALGGPFSMIVMQAIPI